MEEYFEEKAFVAAGLVFREGSTFVHCIWEYFTAINICC